MNARNHLPNVARHSLEALLIEGRVPLDAALQLAQAVIRALEAEHATNQPVGPFDAGSVTVDVLGQVVVKPAADPEGAAPELAAGSVPDLLSDVYSLGAVFYRLFAGVSHVEATKRAGGHLPPPSRFNPTIDDTLDALVLTLLDSDPMERPYRLSAISAQLAAICSEMGLEANTEAISSWVATHRPAAASALAEPVTIPLVVTVPPAIEAPVAPAPVVAHASIPAVAAPPVVVAVAPAPVVTRPSVPTVAAPRPSPARQAAPRIQWVLEADEEEAHDESSDAAWEGPVRFDLWAAASAGVVALGVVIIALL
ncbi:MAG: hypothetical protein JNJ54_24530 [Myxococcaceae bacterium]|nr:hypothetical protein [Myxococcaceae bacterium]